MFRVLLLGIMLSGCSLKNAPIQTETKYPNTPTMQAAEDATKGKL